MAQRKYSVDEIDAMRLSVELIVLNRARPLLQKESRLVQIENELRTHMINGTEPEELTAAVVKIYGPLQPLLMD